MLDELIQLYNYAEDLDTYEHAAKELSTFLAGPVSLQRPSYHLVGNGFLTESGQGCEGDLLDDVRHSIIAAYETFHSTARHPYVICAPTADWILGTKLSPRSSIINRAEHESDKECKFPSPPRGCSAGPVLTRPGSL